MKSASYLLPLLIVGACAQPVEPVNTVNMAAPTQLVAQQLSSTSLQLTWADNCDNEQGYYVFSSASRLPAATLPAGSTSYVFQDLKMLESYSFSVRAFGNGSDISPLARTEVIAMLSADQRNYVDDDSPKVSAPHYVEAEQLSALSVNIVWEDPIQDGKGYNIYLRDTSEVAYRELIATVEKGVSSYLFEDLEPGTMYVAGVQSVGASLQNNSPLRESRPFKLADLAKAPEFTIRSITATSACIAVDYAISKLPGARPVHGVCLSQDHIPTVSDLVFPGPIAKDGLQVITSGALQYGVDYRLRVYAKVGDEYYYSPTQHISLGAAPEAISFNWTEVTGLGLPEGIQVFKTQDPLNGRPFNAWYAIADCTGDIEFRVLNPSAKATIDEQAQAAGDCYVLINGGIYGAASQLHIGPVISDGQLSSWREEVDAQYWGSDKKLHYITRSMFGVDASGKPVTAYAFYASPGNISYYDRPIPSVAGEPLYDSASGRFPAEPMSWSPQQALSTGPLVLHHGQIPVDLSKDPRTGTWLTNFELWADDIFATHPDRTCVGYTEDGKIVLLVCDGRIAASDGAYLSEMGQIMKGLGCTGALNLDGGGSTGMWAGGKHLNALLIESGEEVNRPVISTLGFFKSRKTN